MNAIEKAAKKYSESEIMETYDSALEALKRISFIAGVEFAQQWISPRDEMPPVGELVQVKVKWRDDSDITYYHDKRTVGNGYDDFEINQTVGLEVVGWRPINLK
jgi:hypothetical protein